MLWRGTELVCTCFCDVYSNIMQTYMVIIFHMACMCTLCIGARARQEVKDGGAGEKGIKTSTGTLMCLVKSVNI